MSRPSEKLSEFISDELITKLREESNNSKFPGISFEEAMQFILTDGIIPISNANVNSYLKLEDWIRSAFCKEVYFSATDLKNKTGAILEEALKGRLVKIVKHGRPIVEIKAL